MALKGKINKSIPVTERGGPQVCETSKLPHYLYNRLTDGGEVVTLMRRSLFIPGRFLVFIAARNTLKYPLRSIREPG
jgi:hypothetical protein